MKQAAIPTAQSASKNIFRPKQERSSRTQAAILQAARDMLAEGGVESLTIASLAARVGLTTGAFYARFRNKEALLQTLFEETLTLNGAAMNKFFTDVRTSKASLAEIIITFIPQAMELIRDNSALFRLLGSDHRTPIGEEDRAILLLEGAIIKVRALLQRHTDEIPDSDLSVSAAMLVVMVQGMVDWSLHLRHSKCSLVPVDDDKLAIEISRATLGYLGLQNQRRINSEQLVE
jgi:AcrR family transcriptional regulator